MTVLEVKEVLFLKLFASVLIDEVFAGIQVAGENINAVATLLQGDIGMTSLVVTSALLRFYPNAVKIVTFISFAYLNHLSIYLNPILSLTLSYIAEMSLAHYQSISFNTFNIVSVRITIHL